MDFLLHKDNFYQVHPIMEELNLHHESVVKSSLEHVASGIGHTQ